MNWKLKTLGIFLTAGFVSTLVISMKCARADSQTENTILFSQPRLVSAKSQRSEHYKIPVPVKELISGIYDVVRSFKLLSDQQMPDSRKPLFGLIPLSAKVYAVQLETENTGTIKLYFYNETEAAEMMEALEDGIKNKRPVSINAVPCAAIQSQLNKSLTLGEVTEARWYCDQKESVAAYPGIQVNSPLYRTIKRTLEKNSRK